MTIQIDERTMNMIAAKTARIVVRMLRNEGATDQRLISCREASERLGVKPDTLRRMKHCFTHVKRGNGKQAHLFFDADLLINEYQKIRNHETEI